jgi:hypothetical protein
MHFRWAFEHPELSCYLLSRQHPEVRLASQAAARGVNREYAAWVEGWLEQGGPVERCRMRLRR